jgi:hypothetical protein
MSTNTSYSLVKVFFSLALNFTFHLIVLYGFTAEKLILLAFKAPSMLEFTVIFTSLLIHKLISLF